MARINVISPEGERGTIDASDLQGAMEDGFRILDDIQEAPKGYMQQVEEAIMGNPVGRFAVGAGEAIKNQLANVANLIPGVDIPITKSGEGLAYELGNIGGNLAGFLGGGGLLNLARKGAESLPLLGQAAKSLGGEGAQGIARRAIGTGAYGAIESPEDRLGGAQSGAMWSAGLEGLAKAGGKVFGGVRPQKLANDIWKEISGGKTLEENAQSLASSIKEAYRRNAKEPNGIFNKIKNEVGSESVYPGFGTQGVHLEQINKMLKDSEARGFDVSSLKDQLMKQYGIKNLPSENTYIRASEDMTSLFDRGTKRLHDKFAKDPNYENGHELLKQLGLEARQLEAKRAAGKLDHYEKSVLDAYQEGKELLRNDIKGVLNSKDPKLAEEFSMANELWMKNVAPYKSNSSVYKMARGKIENPSQIASLFKSPEADIKKIVEDLGEKGASQILYSQLGKLTKKGLPEHLIDKSQQLKNQGLEYYFSPKLNDQLDSLAGRVTRRNFSQKGAVGLGGSLVGSQILGPAGYALGAGAALLRTPDIAGKISPAMEAISKISPSYDLIRKALLSNIVGTPTHKRIKEQESKYGT